MLLVCFSKLKCNISSERENRGREGRKKLWIWSAGTESVTWKCAWFPHNYPEYFCPVFLPLPPLFFNLVTSPDYGSGLWKYLLEEGNCTGLSLWPFRMDWEMKKEGVVGEKECWTKSVERLWWCRTPRETTGSARCGSGGERGNIMKARRIEAKRTFLYVFLRQSKRPYTMMLLL